MLGWKKTNVCKGSAIGHFGIGKISRVCNRVERGSGNEGTVMSFRERERERNEGFWMEKTG